MDTFFIASEKVDSPSAFDLATLSSAESNSAGSGFSSSSRSDSSQWRIGIELRANQHWDLRLGYLEDDTPQPAAGMSPLLSDADRKAYMGGLGYHTDRFRFDIAYEYVDPETRSTEGMSHDGFDGTYESESPLLHMSFTLKF